MLVHNLLNFSEAVDPSRITYTVIHHATQAETISIVINTNVVAKPGSSIIYNAATI